MCFPGAKELCERPQYNHSGTIFRTNNWCMQVLQIEEKELWTRTKFGQGMWDQGLGIKLDKPGRISPYLTGQLR